MSRPDITNRLSAAAPQVGKPVKRVHPNLGTEAVAQRLGRRRRQEKRFRWYCLAAVGLAMLFLLILFGDILSKGWQGFRQTEVDFEVFFDPEIIDPSGERDPTVLAAADYAPLWRVPLLASLGGVEGRSERRAAYGLISSGAVFDLQSMVMDDPSLLGTHQSVRLPASDATDLMMKRKLSRDLPEDQRPLDDQQLAWLDQLRDAGRVHLTLNSRFLTSGDSRSPELAGIAGAVTGSFYVMMVTFLLAFPLGVATAVYLEEFAPTNRWTDLIEVNINNLAAVPSIVYGLLGLAVFLNFFGLPRSAPLAGGLVLTLMTLPTIIITSRVAIKSVPSSLRQAAFGLGATPLQVVRHQVLPQAMPGILTGTIIGLARALGETAPLLMIGMVAFIVDIPEGPLSPATALPVQIYLWADSPERGFLEKTSAAILVLLAFLIVMNGFAVWMRRRWEQTS
ncbi:MAG: phosphate ABC transporter permease PstA [Thermoanaerobaculia bacterium]|nr:phosphate ABC transporter permease PstA [Thermoanaerobaculia bacterium]